MSALIDLEAGPEAPKPWPEEDLDERLDALKAETRWVITIPHGHIVPKEGGHLMVLHASTVLELIATLEKYRAR